VQNITTLSDGINWENHGIFYEMIECTLKFDIDFSGFYIMNYKGDSPFPAIIHGQVFSDNGLDF
jgi:hypothetical protein